MTDHAARARLARTGGGRRRPAAAWLGAGLLVLVAAWLFAPATAGPPLYDGIGFPDEPYRYVGQSAHGSRKPPTIASAVVGRGPGGFASVLAASAEQGPQIKFGMQAGALVAPAGCTQVAVAADPLAPPASAAAPWGNAYQVSLTCTAGVRGPVRVTAATEDGDTSYIQLRAPDATQPGPTLAYSPDATTWRKLATLRVANDVYQAPMVGPGFYVLLRAPGSGSLFGLDSTVVVPISVLAVFVAAILVIRWSRVQPDGPTDTDAEDGYEGWTGGDGGDWAGGGRGEDGDPIRREPDQTPG